MRIPDVFKPWYVYRPSQAVRRAVRAVWPPRDPVRVVRLPWGCDLEVDVRETIGLSVWTTGVYDLAVAEVLYRLADPGQLAVDVGANVGAMTGVLAARAAEVWAVEPHPAVAARLRRNAARLAAARGFAPVAVLEVAASDADGSVTLAEPDGFAGNQGTARVGGPAAGGRAVPAARLDGLLAGRPVGVMKVDVEGHELAALRGAGDSLAGGRVAHVVYEDHDGADSPVGRFLSECGFAVLAVGWGLTGPRVGRPGVVRRAAYEAPSYLATRDLAGTARRLAGGGWECLRGRPRRPAGGGG